VVELGADVEADAARATYEDGMLRVEIPLLEQRSSTRQVPISGRTPAEGDRELSE
jgi:HSP20 family protein